MRARVKPVNPHPSCFQNKLWKMVESNQFMSIWWSEGGKCIAVNEDLFKQKCWAGQDLCVLLLTESMKSFIRQLNAYGFTKVRRDFQRSAYLPEFLAEDDAAAAHSKVQQLEEGIRKRKIILHHFCGEYLH
uniref:HSF-type DNA-binding domain-containing protein n=1 Tax=Accipiter nisus TaxID=211598 RepID=A0A8B9M7P9_9AVES